MDQDKQSNTTQPTISRFDRRLQDTGQEVLFRIAQVEELKGQWIGGAKLDPQTLSRLKRSVLVTSTGASTRIEGVKLSDEDIEKIMRGINIQTFTNRDQQEVRGYYELLVNVFDSWKKLNFSESAIKHFHQELLKYVEKDQSHRGDYKKQENQVHMVDQAGQSIGVLFDTTPAYLTTKEMQELVEWTHHAFEKQRFHPILIIGNFIVEFLHIHPFQDGNGRLSRILTNLLLLKSGYEYMPYVSHEKLIEDNKPEYYIALRQSQKTFKTEQETIIPFLTFFLTILLKQSHMAVELLSNENIDKLLSPQQLKVWKYLEFVEEATPMEISQATGVARPTINQAVDKLIKIKKIERIGLGRATRYKKR